MKIICEESVQLIKEHLSEIDLTFPLDDENGGYRIFKFFESMDANICEEISSSNDEKDKKLIRDVDRILSEFINPDEPIDYQDLEARLKS